MINVEMDLRTAAAVRQVLFYEQRNYTQDPTCVPQRISDIRCIIVNIDEKIEEYMNETNNT